MTNEELKEWLKYYDIYGLSFECEKSFEKAARELSQLKDGTHPDMVMVPREPTEEMCFSGSGFHPNCDRSGEWYEAGISVAKECYKAMIAATEGSLR